MICSSSNPSPRRLSGEGRGPRGFTLVELLVVILILAILIALLLPALNGALRTAKNAAVGGEINQLAQALASFKAKYGDYPPSRIYLSEDGNLHAAASSFHRRLQPGDITYAQLGQRSIAAMRKFFPRVTFEPRHRDRATGTTSTVTDWVTRPTAPRSRTSSRATSAWSSSWAAFRRPPPRATA